MSFPNTIYGDFGDRTVQSSSQKQPLGTRLIVPDGRVYHYAKAGGTALDVGKLMQQAVVASGHGSDLAVAAAAAIGASAATITNATTAITADMYKEGYLFVNDEAGEGQYFRIKSNPAEATGTGSCIITFEAEDALITALTTVSQVGLRKNPYDSVVVNPTTITGIPVGVTPRAVTADYYFWLQTWGPAAVLGNGTLIRGLTVVPSATTAGAVDVYPLNSVGTSGQQPAVGYVMTVAASTEYSLVFLTLAP